MGDFLDEAINDCDSLDMLHRGLDSIKRKIEKLEKRQDRDDIYVPIGSVYMDGDEGSDVFYDDNYEDNFIVLSKTEIEYLKSKFKYREFNTVAPIIINEWNEDDDFSLTIDQFVDDELTEILKGDFESVFRDQFGFELKGFDNEDRDANSVYFLITKSFYL